MNRRPPSLKRSNTLCTDTRLLRAEVPPVSSTAVTAASSSLVNTRDVTAKSDADADNLPLVAGAGSGEMRDAKARPIVSAQNRGASLSSDSSFFLNVESFQTRTDGPSNSTAFAATSSSRSEEHTSELQSLMRISYAVFCLKKKNIKLQYASHTNIS